LATLVRNARTTVMMNSRELERKDVPVPLDHLTRHNLSINESLGESSYQQVFQWLFYLLVVSSTVRTEGSEAGTELTFWSLLPSSLLSTISLSLGQNKAHSLSAEFSSSFTQKLVYLFACTASTVSSQILLTHLFLLLSNLPSILGAFAFALTLGFLPRLFFQLRFRLLPRCLPNLTCTSDLCVDGRENPNYRAFIESLQLQSSKFKVNQRFVQNRSHCSLFQENLLAHIILQLLSLALTCLYAFAADDHLSPLRSTFFATFPPPAIALTGSPALNNFLIVSAILGPGLWLASQLLLLLYFWLDNGANTFVIDFHFRNNQNKRGDVKKVEAKENMEKILLSCSTSKDGIEDPSEEEGLSLSSDKTEDDSISIIIDNEPRGNTFFEFKVLEELFINKFKLVSEEGRWVDPQFDDEELQEEAEQ